MSGGDAAGRLHERLARALVGNGATVMFGLPGGGPNLDVIGAAVGVGMRFVLAHGETAAAIMASTHGLLSAAPAPVVVTRGPGAASVANGLAQATLDRYPVVAIADTVPARTASRVAHQRLDQRALLGPVCKVSATISDDTDPTTLDELIAAAPRWPFGAVHLDYDPTAGIGSPPERTAGPDLVAASASGPDNSAAASGWDPGPGAAGRSAAVAPVPGLETALQLLAGAERPVVIAGMEAAVAGPGVAGSLQSLGCPVLTTYQAIGVVPTEGPHHAGLFTNGAVERPLLDEADLVVTVGLDLVEPIPQPWSYSCPVIRVSSTVQLDAYLPATVDLRGDVITITEALATAPRSRTWSDDAGATFRREARDRLLAVASPEPTGFGPLELVAGLGRCADHVGTVTVDAGAHFLAIMPLWPVSEPLRLLISNGLATMGFAIPAGIGAALARPGEPVLALTGDGGASMALAELETIARLDLPMTIVVFNDGSLSLIRIKQQPQHGGPAAVHHEPVDYALTARAAGLEGVIVRSAEELSDVIGEGSATGGGWRRPRLIDARIDPGPYEHLLAVTRG